RGTGLSTSRVSLVDSIGERGYQIRALSDGTLLFEPYTRSGQLVLHLLNETRDRRVILRGNT
ncbi:hypothetical protein, partial [Infirmifilum uzonense]|uniref:hypothetical protein n=1 Tax=Infirmifilum uzonense TaxID=1550241 RepID=UPI003C76E4F3